MGGRFFRQLDDGIETGPFSRDELVEMIHSGELRADDLLRTANSTVWVSARRISGLFSEVENLASNIDDRTAYAAQIAELVANPEVAMARRSSRRSSRWWQDQIGWEGILAAILIVLAGSWLVWGTQYSVRFPSPRRLQAAVPEGHYFFGSGPWSTLEYILLWLDAVVVTGALLFWRRILGRRE